MNFSLEIGPNTDLKSVPPISDVYSTMLPGGDYKETAEKAAELVKKGFNPVPHFPARSMQDEKELKDYVSRYIIFELFFILHRSCREMRNRIKSFFNKFCCFFGSFFIISTR